MMLTQAPFNLVVAYLLAGAVIHWHKTDFARLDLDANFYSRRLCCSQDTTQIGFSKRTRATHSAACLFVFLSDRQLFHKELKPPRQLSFRGRSGQ
jgi:hypothetical protein